MNAFDDPKVAQAIIATGRNAPFDKVIVTAGQIRVLNFDQRRVQVSFRELIAMHDISLRNAANRCSQLSQCVSEQPEVDLHVIRFVDFVSARPFVVVAPTFLTLGRGSQSVDLQARWA